MARPTRAAVAGGWAAAGFGIRHQPNINRAVKGERGRHKPQRGLDLKCWGNDRQDFDMARLAMPLAASELLVVRDWSELRGYGYRTTAQRRTRSDYTNFGIENTGHHGSCLSPDRPSSRNCLGSVLAVISASLFQLLHRYVTCEIKQLGPSPAVSMCKSGQVVLQLGLTSGEHGSDMALLGQAQLSFKIPEADEHLTISRPEYRG